MLNLPRAHTPSPIEIVDYCNLYAPALDSKLISRSFVGAQFSSSRRNDHIC